MGCIEKDINDGEINEAMLFLNKMTFMSSIKAMSIFQSALPFFYMRPPSSWV